MKRTLHIITTELFQAALLLYSTLSIAELLKKGFVSHTIRLENILYIVISSGLISVITHSEHQFPSDSHKHTISELDWWFIFGTGSMAGVLIYGKTSDLGVYSYILAAACGGIVTLISFLIFNDVQK